MLHKAKGIVSIPTEASRRLGSDERTDKRSQGKDASVAPNIPLRLTNLAASPSMSVRAKSAIEMGSKVIRIVSDRVEVGT